MTMELHRRSCVLPSNAPALPDSNISIPSRVLQERSVNRRHDYTDIPSTWKRSTSPLEHEYSGRLGSYFTGNIATQFNGEKSEVQIECETKRLLRILRSNEKYRKYRERQPQTAKDREQKWPDHQEEAFFRGLVRWPPMGRRKHMLDGQLRGRNELVADSIFRDTGEERTRKQVSSHIQVLKNILSDCPQILVYMSTADLAGRRPRNNNSHHGHQRSRFQAHGKYDYSQGGSNSYQGYGQLPTSVTFAKTQSIQDDTPYTVVNFNMYVAIPKRQVHDYTQLSSNSRHTDLIVADTTSWHKQYPEFNFHRVDELKKHKVLVCDASIKIMTVEKPIGAELVITFELRSQVDLAQYDSLETRTRFFENGKVADQLDENDNRVRQTRTPADFYASQHDGGTLAIKFGSKFWAYQMLKLGHLLRKAGEEELGARARYESAVRKELQCLTAAQDIYGVKDGEARCFLTLLWRFTQTRTSHEAGRVSWRVVHFGPPKEWRRLKDEELSGIKNAKVMMPMADPMMATSIPPSTSSIYPSHPLEFNQPFAQHPPPLDLETLGLESMTSDFSNPNSATAPSLATDYSQTHSLSSLTHNHDSIATQSHGFQDVNAYNFTGGHITIAGCLEPTNLDAYDTYDPHSHPNAMPSLHSIAGLDDPHVHHDTTFNSLGLDATMANCYATKPSWHHPALISHLESAAEQYSDLMMQTSAGHVEGAGVVGHGVLHDGQMNAGLWKLQSAFGEDTGVGADGRNMNGRKDSFVGRVHGDGGHGAHSGLGILDLMDRERPGEGRFRAY